jgi:hypothetical protein
MNARLEFEDRNVRVNCAASVFVLNAPTRSGLLNFLEMPLWQATPDQIS